MNNKKKCQQKAEKEKKKYKILFAAITNKTRSETNKIKALIPMKDFFQTNNKTREPNYFKFNLF